MDKSKLKEQSERLFQLHMEITGFYNEFAKSQNLTLTALKVLHIIYKKADCTQQMITQMSFLPKQTVNAIIQTLLEKGIVSLKSEDTTDRRNKIIKLTEEGEKYTHNIITNLNEYDYKALDCLGEKKVNQLINIVAMYRDNLK